MQIAGLVRKEFRSAAIGNGPGYLQEENNLHILCRLKHPNIVRLISSYKFRGKINFLFPQAQGGSLHELLRTKDRPRQFETDSSFLLALCHLASAIATVHSFTIKELNLSMIGCHHDLKPRNILVHEDNFLLSDFGLARLKSATQSSKSDFTFGPAWYLAPECEDYEDDYEKHTISRPSDIWSFGCILLESLTYLLEGGTGVVDFEKKRKVRLGNVTTYAFHAGPSSVNPGVVAWMLRLEDIASKTSPHLTSLVDLVKRMLAIEPTQRPSASETMLSLQRTYLAMSFQQLCDSFRCGYLAHDNYELKAEYERFQIWGSLSGLVLVSGDESDSSSLRRSSPQMAFEDATDQFRVMQERLDDLLNLGSQEAYACQRAIAETIDTLCTLLSPNLQRQLQIRLEQELLSKADPDELNRAAEALTTTPMHKRLGMLATIRRVCDIAESRKTPERPELELEGGLVRCTVSEADYDLGFMVSLSHERDKRVLVEYVTYDVHWEGPITEEMIIRIEAIAELHNHEEKPQDLRSLHCIGFYHNAHKHAFALVYRFPVDPIADSEQVQIYDLRTIIERSRSWKERPTLDDRYRLARTLSTSLLEFHLVNWLHKSLSANHIVFFRRESIAAKTITSAKDLESPYIIGFNHSRPDEPSAFTDGPGITGSSRAYQHPQYTERKSPFRLEFDYFSLGLILLEIGLWTSLPTMTSGRKLSSSEERRRHLLSQYVPLLGHHMGREYRAAVGVCLEGFGSAEGDGHEEGSGSKLSRFSEMVAERLRALSPGAT